MEKPDTTRVQQGTTQVKYETTRDNTSTIRCNRSISRRNTSTKEARAAKIGLCFSLFVTQLYILLISFRNG